MTGRTTGNPEHDDFLQSLRVAGTGFPADFIFPSQVRDRLQRVDGNILALSLYLIEASNGKGGQKFLDCFDYYGYSAWTERWKAFKEGLSWWDININTVGTWDSLDVYEREFETWRKTMKRCGAKVPAGIEKPPESKTGSFLGGTGLLLLGAAGLLLATRRR